MMWISNDALLMLWVVVMITGVCPSRGGSTIAFVETPRHHPPHHSNSCSEEGRRQRQRQQQQRQARRIRTRTTTSSSSTTTNGTTRPWHTRDLWSRRRRRQQVACLAQPDTGSSSGGNSSSNDNTTNEDDEKSGEEKQQQPGGGDSPTDSEIPKPIVMTSTTLPPRNKQPQPAPADLYELYQRQEEADRKLMNRLLLPQRIGNFINTFAIVFIVTGFLLNLAGYDFALRNGKLGIDTIEARQFLNEVNRSTKR